MTSNWELLTLANVTVRVLFAGDANVDGVVGLSDFEILKSNLGGRGTHDKGDFDGDGDFDLADFSALKANFGARSTGQPIQPEADEEATFARALDEVFGDLLIVSHATVAHASRVSFRGRPR